MNPPTHMAPATLKKYSPRRRAWGSLSLALLLSVTASHSASAQIYVANFAQNTIGEYNLNGTVINPDFVTEQQETSGGFPEGLLLSGGDLYVANSGDSTIAEYNATTGTTVNSALAGASVLGEPDALAISGNDLFIVNQTGPSNSNIFLGSLGELNLTSGAYTTLQSSLFDPMGVAVFGSNVYVANALGNGGNGSIGVYNLTSGTYSTLISSDVSTPFQMAVSADGSELYVVNDGNGNVGEYSTAGAVVNASLISGLNDPFALTLSGDTLYVSTAVTPAGGTATSDVAEYTLSGTGASTTATFDGDTITNLPYPTTGIAVQAVPEPSTWALFLLLSCGLFALRSRFFRALK